MEVADGVQDESEAPVSSDRKFSLSNYPLSWPDGWARTPNYNRKYGHFKRERRDPSVMEGVRRILDQLSMMGISKDNVLISTNVATRLDGMPRSDQRAPTDPGVAVYWRKGQNAEMQCMAVDVYIDVADNLCAVAAVLEAMRAIERHGGKQVQERSFRGFKALPAKTGHRPWREVMEWGHSGTPTVDLINFAFRILARKRHPDLGGTEGEMAELNQARADALAEIES